MTQTVLLLLLTLLLALSQLFAPPRGEEVAVPPPPGARHEEAVVTGEEVLLRATPAGPPLPARLHRGERVTVHERVGAWARVEAPDGRQGYLQGYLLRPVPLPPQPGRVVWGYFVRDAASPSLPSFEAHGDLITGIIPWMWGLDLNGSLREVYVDRGEVAAALGLAGRRGRSTQALVHNYRNGVGFDPEVARRVLSDPRVRARALEGIEGAVTRWSMSGVHLDFEQVPAELRDDLTGFVEELAVRLRGRGLSLSVAVPAQTAREAARSPRSAAYDYAALARAADHLVVMAYDQHWRGGPPGPVAGADWVEEVVLHLLSLGVPAGRLVLGLPAYGYDWPPAGQGLARAVTYREASERLEAARARDPHVRLQWEPVARVPYFQYEGRQVWFENHQSLSHKLLLVSRYGLAGIALWRLGQEDPAVWTVVRSLLG